MRLIERWPPLVAALIWTLLLVAKMAGAGALLEKSRLVSLLAAGALAVTAMGLGSHVRYKVGLQIPSAPLRWAAAGGLGLGLMSILCFALAATGLFRPLPLGLVAIVAGLWSALGWPELVRDWRARWLSRSTWRFRGGLETAAFVIWSVSAFMALGLASVPPSDSDSLRYHLPLPDLYLRSASFLHLPGNQFGAFPQNLEVLYGLGLALAGPVFANLLQWGCAVLCGLAVLGLARLLVSSLAGWLALATFQATPLVGVLAGTATVDLSLALFETLALAVVVLWARQDDEGPRNGRLLALAGVFAGLACGTKYAGLFALPLLVAWVVARSWRRPAIAARNALLLAGVALLVFSPWLVKNWRLEGNPVFPFCYSTFGGRDWQAEDTARYVQEVRRYGFLGGNWKDYLLAGYYVSLYPKAYGGRVGIGLVYLLCLPLLLVAGRRIRPLAPLLLYALGSYLVWLFAAQVVRFLVPLLPVLAVAVGAALDWALQQVQARTVAAPLVAGLLALHALWLGAEQLTNFTHWGCLVSAETTDAYLERRVDYYAAAEWANANLSRDTKTLFFGETRPYYFKPPYRADPGFGQVLAVKLANESLSAAAMSAELRRRGFTHVLYDTRGWREQWATLLPYFRWRDDASRQRFADLLTKHSRLVHEAEPIKIYELGTARPPAGANSGFRTAVEAPSGAMAVGR